MKTTLIRTFGLVVIVAIIAGLQRYCTAAESKPARKVPIVVKLVPSIEIDSHVIRLGDIAAISCGDTTLRDKLKQLDLEDPLEAGESVTISPARVEMRIRVARIDASGLSIQGSGSRVTGKGSISSRKVELVKAGSDSIPLPPPLSDGPAYEETATEQDSLETLIVEAAKNCVMEKLPWPAESIEIKLSQPLLLGIRHGRSAEDYSFSGDLRTGGPAVGRVHVRVTGEAPGKPMFEVPVVLDVRRFDQVVVANKALERGRVITEDDLFVDRQNVTDLAEYSSTPEELIGMKLKRPIRALMPVRKCDVEVEKAAQNAILVRRKEQVHMVARIAGANISAVGEALQEGRLGETIRLRNVESNITVRGRVTAANEVEITF